MRQERRIPSLVTDRPLSCVRESFAGPRWNPLSPRERPSFAHGEGVSLAALFGRFPDDATAEVWFVSRVRPAGVRRPYPRVDFHPDFHQTRDDASGLW